MEKYIFILGQSRQLAIEEIQNIVGNVEEQGNDFVVAESKKDPKELINQLGGTIKIAKYIATVNELSHISEPWLNMLDKDQSKIYFGFSLYSGSQKNYISIKKLALEIKKNLKADGHKCRLVSSKEPVLSSVIVTKNKLIGNELIIIKQENQFVLAQTIAVQDFAKYGLRDFKRPGRDDKSGMLPPKVAQMMINLAGKDRGKNILDPFCGSGTVLQEAALLGFETLYGADISKKAVSDTENNLEWLSGQFGLKFKQKIIKTDIKDIDSHIKNNSIDLIVTEPFMGDARQVQKIHKSKDLSPIKNELENLYLSAFSQFKKLLKPNGTVVFVFPEFDLKDKKVPTLNQSIIESKGFVLNKKLAYSRPGQKVIRKITFWQLTS